MNRVKELNMHGQEVHINIKTVIHFDRSRMEGISVLDGDVFPVSVKFYFLTNKNGRKG